MRLLITGSRDASDEMFDYAVRVVKRAKELNWAIVVGDAPGVDAAVINACDRMGVPVEVHSAYGRIRNGTQTGTNTAHEGPYRDRDRVMVELCEACLAVWNGYSPGTRRTFEYAKGLGKRVWVKRLGKRGL